MPHLKLCKDSVGSALLKEVRAIIGRNTKKIGNLPYSITKSYGTWNEYYGYGLIDAYQAIVHTPLF